MKILAISHSCVTDVNQQLFVALRRQPGVDGLELIVPSLWKSEYSSELHPPSILPAVDFPIHACPIGKPGNVSLHFYKSLPIKQLRKFRPDVVLSTQEPWSLSNLQAIWLAKKLRVPLVFQTNQNILKNYPPPFSWIERLSYRTAAAGLAYSEEARQVMLRKGLRKPSHVVPYGTDLSLFSPGVSPLRERLGLGQSFVIGYIGRLVPEKGLETLVQAIALVRQQFPQADVRVLLVGSGSEETALKRQIAEAGITDICVFTGSVPHREAGDYMRCLDAFVLPSKTMPNWKEQFGRVIIEAMACQVPVIGSDSGQIPHLIQETGGGLVFPESSPVALAAHLQTLIQNPEIHNHLGKTGREAVCSRYTYEAIAAQLYEILQSVTKSGNNPEHQVTLQVTSKIC